MKCHHRNTHSIFLLISILLVAILVNPLHAAQESKHVFVLNSFNRGYTWTDNMLRGIDDAFSGSGLKVETYVTFMDMKRIPPTPQYLQRLKELIQGGYTGVRFDAVLACDNDAFEFAKKYRDELFPGVPVVFSSINDFDERMLEGRKDITGTSENTDYTGTIKAALKILPATKNIVVVTDNTTTGKAHRSAVEKVRPDFPQNLGFTYISLADMTMDELAGKLSKLERNSIVLLLQHFKDKDGTSYTVQESTPLLTKSSSVPVFVLADIRIGLGALGGHVVSGYHHGEAAAQMVVKILKGTDVKSIPVLLDSPNKYIFDYGVMQRFKIAEKDLPQGSILINKPLSLLDKYRPYLYAILCIFILLSGFIFYLLREISRRKKIETSLQVANDKLQEQYEELQLNEESLQDQNDALLSTEEMLRVQINEYEASQILLKERDEALWNEKAFLRSLIDSATDLIYFKDRDGKYVGCNKASEAFTGRTEQEQIGKSDFDFFDQEMAEQIAWHDQKVLEGGVAVQTEEWVISATSGRLLLDTVKTPIYGQDGLPIGLVGISRDITERNQAETVLRESNEILSLFMHHSPIYTYIKEVTPTESRVLQASENFIEMVGIPGSQMVGKTMEELFPSEFAAKITENDWAVVSGGIVLKVDEYFNGRTYNTVKSPLIKGEKTLLAGFTIDITERKRAEDELKKQNSLFDALLKNLQIGIYLMEVPSGIPLLANEASFKLLGRGILPEANSTTITEVYDLHKSDTNEPYPNEELPLIVAMSGESKHVEDMIVVKPDGTRTALEVFGSPIRDEKGNIWASLVSFQDITERKQHEILMANLSQRLQMATSSAHLGVWDWNVRENTMVWDDRMFELYGITRETFPNGIDVWMNGLHPEDKEKALAECQAALNGEKEFNTEFRVLHPEGSVKHIRARGLVLFGTDGTADRMLGINYDITELKRAEAEKHTLEQQLQHTQKLESLGVLSGGIAHDFNNILAIIMGYCSLTKMDYETAEKNIQEIEKAAERAAALCRQMLAYAGKAQLSMSQINMRMLVDEMVTMLKATLPQNAEINSDFSTDIPFINGDSSQLRQIVMNLIINASEAIGKEQGKIRVSLATTAIKTGQSEQDYNGNTIPPGEYVCLEVTDNGCGMDEETKWRIFEPFYTTKFTGRGLGMSAVLGIIKSHGGVLQLHSQLGQGTTFKVYLPVPIKKSTEDEGQKQSAPSSPWQGSGTVLLVEDEDEVRYIAKALLENFGFAVLEAVNGKEALEMYQKNAADITLIVTDMGMPVMDGYELCHKLKNLNPELPIIISSGYGDVEVGSRIGSDNIAGLISKPYNPAQLRKVLRKALEDAANNNNHSPGGIQ